MTVVRSSDDRLFVAFFRKTSVFSNFYRSHFTGFNSDGLQRRFSSNEQYYYSEKCIFFKRHDLLDTIMRESSPSTIKRLCKVLKSTAQWDDISQEYMRKGLIYKFSQNLDLMRLLFSTIGCTLVEASPFDLKWGIGMVALPECQNTIDFPGLSTDHVNVPYPDRWLGNNWLGNNLMSVRSELSEIAANKETHFTILSKILSTQTHFADLLEKYRTEILPKVNDEWATMSDDERAAHKIFQSLPCQMHVIASSISPAMRALAKLEETLTGAKDLKEDTCSVNKALQLFTHHFGARASGKYGTYRIFRAWCHSKKINCNSLPALIGNRFVIIPAIAARIFLNRMIYSQFLKEVDIESKKSLLDALSNEIVMKHIQTLGFVDQCVTGPLWRILNSEVNTLDTDKYITAFNDWMQERVSDPSKIFDLTSPMVGLVVPENTFKYSGSIMKELQSVPTCPILEQSVSDVLKAMKDFISEVLSPFTSGGSIHSIATTDSVINRKVRGMLGAAPATNMGCESVFGYADYLINRAPRKRMSRVEGELLSTRNNVFEWLDSLDAKERDKIIKECIRESRQLEKESKVEADQLNEAILEMEAKKAEMNEARKARICALDKELTVYLLTYGFFQSADDVDTFIQNEADVQNQLTVLVKQLRYRQKILKQQPKGKKFFTVSEGKKTLTVAQLRVKLVNAIENDPKLRQNQVGDSSLSSIAQKTFIQNGNDGSFRFTITNCFKSSQNGPSYVTIKYEHRPFEVAMTWEYFSVLTDSQIFQQANS